MNFLHNNAPIPNCITSKKLALIHLEKAIDSINFARRVIDDSTCEYYQDQSILSEALVDAMDCLKTSMQLGCEK